MRSLFTPKEVADWLAKLSYGDIAIGMLATMGGWQLGKLAYRWHRSAQYDKEYLENERRQHNQLRTTASHVAEAYGRYAAINPSEGPRMACKAAGELDIRLAALKGRKVCKD